jgi:hypothetical protein
MENPFLFSFPKRAGGIMTAALASATAVSVKKFALPADIAA